ncbi:UDP-glucose 4-epimerase GalE [Aquimarina latercula]|uniref:UDP-glucose 4-epimerase GalE n=1 Tax=Aquimarina latercula TaxID=987 RepID=UPI000407FEBF|nr:UDP-glucose 4-epimerase GalE [Aquimarina latercula]
MVTGGLGYIGSHTVVELINIGFDVVIVDNLSNSRIDVLEGIKNITGVKPFFEYVHLNNKEDVQNLFFQYNDIKNIIHFAASKAVGESIEKPLQYYENNINPILYLLIQLSKKKDVNFIFSSSCTIYGEPNVLPIREDEPIKPALSVYGNTKQIGEEILKDFCKINESISATVLRYFNPIGAHDSSEIGELPLGVPQNLVPFITQTAIGKREELLVFGDDYNTNDGTCVRDYIHVVDLAIAHVMAIKRLMGRTNESNYEIFNLGAGTGNSVMEIIKSFEKVSFQKLNYKIAPRRKGDVTATYADNKKAYEVLGWKPQRSLEQALKSAWDWELKIHQG